MQGCDKKRDFFFELDRSIIGHEPHRMPRSHPILAVDIMKVGVLSAVARSATCLIWKSKNVRNFIGVSSLDLLQPFCFFVCAADQARLPVSSSEKSDRLVLVKVTGNLEDGIITCSQLFAPPKSTDVWCLHRR
jgi:hypothetical protein